MKDDSFIDTTNRVLAQGCHWFECGKLEARKADIRKSNFYVILFSVFGLVSVSYQFDPPENDQLHVLTAHKPTVSMVPPPTPRPARPTPEPINIYSPVLRPVESFISTVNWKWTSSL